jgi:hypothetical protein
MTIFVDIETPYMGASRVEALAIRQVQRNIRYARACVGDSLKRGEIPFASHLFFTQPGILDDNVLKERLRGINAGKELIEALPNIRTVVYTNLGISLGMQEGIERAKKNNRMVEYRTLGDDWEEKQIELENRHSQRNAWMCDF